MYPNSYAYPSANGSESYGYGFNQYGAPAAPGYGSGTPSYPVATPGPGGYVGGAPPHDPSASLSNPAAFERMYRGQLAQLTFNSKPIITNLTLIAQEHVHRMSTLVAKLIDTHIIMSPPPLRLPSMYLMDSICKNIGSPYTELWAPRVATLFLESYRVVDQPTKRRMEELLATWRAAGPGGGPLFGEGPQWTIERSLFGSQGPTPKASSSQPTQSQLLANIERLLALKTQERSRNPHDPSVLDRINVLRELKDKVQGMEPRPELLAEVQRELDVLSKRPSDTRSAHGTPAPVPAPAPAPAAAPVASSPTEGAPSASELIANLMKAGLLPSASTPTPSTPAVVQATNPPRLSQDRQYTDYILSLDLRLTTYDLSRPPPEVELVIKENLPLPCRQCANRYPDTKAGKNGLDLHLDWHFSQNRRSRASIARGQSRSWFDPVPRWIRSGFDDVSDPTYGDDAGTGITPVQEQALREKFASTYVVVPEDPEVAAMPCRICKEKFQSEWSEDLEEWIWKNAMALDNAYVHASCHYSAKTMSESVKEEPVQTSSSQSESATAATDVPAFNDPLPSVDNPSAEMVKMEEETTLKRKASPPDTPPHKKLASEDTTKTQNE